MVTHSAPDVGRLSSSDYDPDHGYILSGCNRRALGSCIGYKSRKYSRVQSQQDVKHFVHLIRAFTVYETVNALSDV